MIIYTAFLQGDLSEFETSFSFACPKFLSPVPPSYDNPPMMSADAAAHKEPLRLQLKVFMDEVKQQLLLPTVRSYLKLYTSMPMDKLATYMNMSVDELENHLLCFKHKMMNVVWTKGTSGLEGEFLSESEVWQVLLLDQDFRHLHFFFFLQVDFYIDKNMIHIADTKVDRRYGDFFIRQIHKFEELNRGLKTLKM